MRIVIDMQGAQTVSRFRGIGRYTLSLTKAIIRNKGNHEIFLALNGLLPETIESIRAEFNDLLPQNNIRTWYFPNTVNKNSNGRAQNTLAECMREAFLLSLQPDIIHISSLFEGYNREDSNAVTSIGVFDKKTPVSVIQYDLIPLTNPDHYFTNNQNFERIYKQKLAYLNRAKIHLAISTYTKQEAIKYLNIPHDQIFNISAAVDDNFCKRSISISDEQKLYAKFSINRSFILYTGGADERKNLPRLIQAFAQLSTEVRSQYQLIISGEIPETTSSHLYNLGHENGLTSDDLCFTGYVTDSELIALYNLCALYVFPSWQEGFGLPVLEAMSCGAPVICGNTSSLPEVMGFEDAMFDPFKVTSIQSKLQQALTNGSFRQQLAEHGLKQAKKFSWDTSAQTTIQAWERAATKIKQYSYIDSSTSYNNLVARLADQPDLSEKVIVETASTLAHNQNSGIERQMFIDISELCQNDAATGVQRVTKSYLLELLKNPPDGFRIEPVYATLEEGYKYARRYTIDFLGLQVDRIVDEELIRWKRGDIFFALDLQHYIQLRHAEFIQQIKQEGVTVKFLVYDLLPVDFGSLFHCSELKKLHEQLLTLISKTDGALCISKATAQFFGKWLREKSIATAQNFKLDWVHLGADIAASHPSLGIPPEANRVFQEINKRPTFLCVSTLEPRKRQQQIIDAVELLWEEGLDINLILVGKVGWKVESLVQRIRKHPENGNRLFWLEGVSDEYLGQIYRHCSCLVAASLNEGFGLSLIEAAQHNLAVIARDIPVFREIAQDAAFYFSGEQAEDLRGALKNWLYLYKKDSHPKPDMMRWLTWKESTEKLKQLLLASDNYHPRQLLVDISTLVVIDGKSGIQRVVWNIVDELLKASVDSYRVELVYASDKHSYRYARKFITSSNNFKTRCMDTHDKPIEYAPGDIFLGLDLSHSIPLIQKDFLEKMHHTGVSIHFVIYDLLPVQFPQYFPSFGCGESSFKQAHEQWLDFISQFSGALCISKTVADEFSAWLSTKESSCRRPFKIDRFSLGADIDNAISSRGVPTTANKIVDKLHHYTSFLMVGTLEPRKAHAQVLEAFEELWQANKDVALVIVGKQGWLTENLVNTIQNHPELDSRLFWLEGISDEYLDKIYAASNCLIAASYGEGFGLPLIEAAQHNVPIIARELPVFREVAGKHAFYFNADKAGELALAIQEWISLYNQEKHPKSKHIPWITWKESADQLLNALLEK